MIEKTGAKQSFPKGRTPAEPGGALENPFDESDAIENVDRRAESETSTAGETVSGSENSIAHANEKANANEASVGRLPT